MSSKILNHISKVFSKYHMKMRTTNINNHIYQDQNLFEFDRTDLDCHIGLIYLFFLIKGLESDRAQYIYWESSNILCSRRSVVFSHGLNFHRSLVSGLP